MYGDVCSSDRVYDERNCLTLPRDSIIVLSIYPARQIVSEYNRLQFRANMKVSFSNHSHVHSLVNVVVSERMQRKNYLRN